MHELVNRQFGAAILTVLVGSTLAWLLVGIPVSGINDADVFMVYARNFLTGHGLVYNVGGEQVEGFPSLLWMLVCSFSYLFSRTVELPLFLLNLLFGIITVYLCLKRCNQKPAFLLLLCSAPAWFAWCQITLVETGLWCMLLTWTILAVSERNRVQCTWLLPLLVLTRPEAMLWGCWLILVLFLGLGLDLRWRVGLRKVFRPLFSFGIVWAGLLLFRGFYFGTLLPSNSSTTHAQGLQVNPEAGILYFLGYLFSNPAVLLVVLVFGWVCIREIRRKSRLSRVSTVCLCLLPGLAIPLMTGDEPFRAFRFYQPIWPLLCLVSAWAMPLLYERQKRLVRRLAPVALLLAGWMIFAFTSNLKYEFSMARAGREQGAVLTHMFEGHPSFPSVGGLTTGGCKYAYPGKVYDLKGLTRAKMDPPPGAAWGAERPSSFDREVFYEWHPDILIRSETDAVDRRVFKELQADPQFMKRYVKGELWYNDQIFFAYYSRRFMNGLSEGHYAFSPDLQYALSMADPPGLSDVVGGEAPGSGLAVFDQAVPPMEAPPFDPPPLWIPPPQL
jgi:arabinofuranosyltransferase